MEPLRGGSLQSRSRSNPSATLRAQAQQPDEIITDKPSTSDGVDKKTLGIIAILVFVALVVIANESSLVVRKCSLLRSTSVVYPLLPRGAPRHFTSSIFYNALLRERLYILQKGYHTSLIASSFLVYLNFFCLHCSQGCGCTSCKIAHNTVLGAPH